MLLAHGRIATIMSLCAYDEEHWPTLPFPREVHDI